jgi:hypothetical protein
VVLVIGRSQKIHADAEVALRGVDFSVTHDPLSIADIATAFEQGRGATCPETMGRDSLTQGSL